MVQANVDAGLMVRRNVVQYPDCCSETFEELCPMAKKKRPAPPMSPERIQAIRTALNLTQQELADRLYTDIRSIQHWLAGDTTPRGTAIKALLDLEASVPRSRLHLLEESADVSGDDQGDEV